MGMLDDCPCIPEFSCFPCDKAGELPGFWCRPVVPTWFPPDMHFLSYSFDLQVLKSSANHRNWAYLVITYVICITGHP